MIIIIMGYNKNSLGKSYDVFDVNVENIHTFYPMLKRFPNIT